MKMFKCIITVPSEFDSSWTVNDIKREFKKYFELDDADAYKIEVEEVENN